MGTIAQKLTYLNGTKQALKEAINNIGGSITSETTFREYAQELDNIYDNLPKTTGEGTNLSLTTLKGKMGIIPKGNISQETTEGYNLFDGKTMLPGTYKNGNVQYTKNSDGTFNLSCNETGTTGTAYFTKDITSLFTIGKTYRMYSSQDFTNTGTAYSVNIIRTGGGVTGLVANGSAVTIPNDFSQAVWVIAGSRTPTYSFSNVKTMIYEGSTEKPYEPYTNGASPNPSFPQDIEVVTGTQEVKVENKNVMELKTLTEETSNGITFTPHYENGILQYVNVNGTATAVASFVMQEGDVNRASTYVSEIKAGTYILSDFSGSTTINKTIVFRYTTDNSTYIAHNSFNLNNFTISKSAKYISYIRIASGEVVNNEKFYPMIELGSTSTSYTPHQEQTQTISLSSKNICNINGWLGYSSNGIEVTKNSSGNLVLNGTSTNIVDIYFTNTSYNTNGEEIANYVNNNYGTYTMSNNLGLQNYFRNSSNQYTENTITTSSTNQLVNAQSRMFVRIASGVTFDNEVLKIQIEKGSSATTFEEYYNYELAKIPNTNYQDKIYHAINGNPIYDSLTSEQKALLNYGSWYKKGLVKKKILNGSEEWTKVSSRFITTINSLDGNYVIQALCDKYIEASTHDEHAATEYSFFVGNSRWGVNKCRVTFNNSNYASIDAWKTYLTSNNLIVYYQLTDNVGGANDIEITDETLIEQLNNIENLMSYNGTTNISSNGNLAMILSVRALKGD